MPSAPNRVRTLRGARAAWGCACALALALPACRANDPGAPAVTSRPIEQVLAEHTPALMRIPGVVGTYQGETDGRPCIRVMVARDTPEIRAAVPRALEGWPVEIDVTGEIRAMPDSGGTPR